MPRVAYQIVKATPELAAQMAPLLRAEDCDEVLAAKRWTPIEALLHSLEVTPNPWALLIGGAPVAMWGVEPVCAHAGVGVAWMLGTSEIGKHRLLFWRLCLEEVARLLRSWNVLINWIDARYEKSLRWAQRLGFVLDEPRPFGPDGRLFCAAAIVR
jgi:hypothetical protein